MSELKIWIIDDGIPGHSGITDGLVSLIGGLRTAAVTRITVHWRWGGVRQIFQFMEKLGVRVPAFLVNATAKMALPAASPPDLIASRGGGTLFLNAWLARETGAANVFIGTIRNMPPRMFRAAILPRRASNGAPYFQMPQLPTRIDASRLPEKAAAFPWTHGQPTGSIASLFLGGDGSGYHYSDDDWKRIATGMMRLYQKSGVRWCVTSSRRTPAAVESMMAAMLPADALHEACWWHAGDRRPCIEAFLGVSDHVFCTEDSMSMLEECIAAGHPVIALGKPDAKPAVEFLDFLQSRVQSRLLLRSTLENFADRLEYPVVHDWKSIPADAMRVRTGELLELLGL